MSDKTGLRCALISADAGLETTLKEVLTGRKPPGAVAIAIREPYSQLGADRLKALRDARPQLVVLDMSEDPAVGIRFAQFLAKADPRLVLVAAGPELTQQQLLATMRAGVSEYLPRPVAAEELREAIARIEHRLGYAESGGRDAAGRVYAVFGAKGGAGATTLAANMAIHLHRMTGERALLVDLDLHLGDGALLLGVQPGFTVSDMVQHLHRMDADLLASYIEQHESGVDVLAAPYQPRGDEAVGEQEIVKILRFLRHTYGHVVVDTSKSLSPRTLAALAQADEVLLVTTAELAALRNLKRCLPLLQGRVESQGAALRVVVNRYDPNDVITLPDIKRTLGVEVYGTLRNDYATLVEAVNKGRPVALDERTRYSQDLASLCATLTGLRDGASSSPGIRGLLQRILPR